MSKLWQRIAFLYRVHVRWRIRVRLRQLWRAWQRLRLLPFLKKLRPLWVLLAAGFSLGFASWLVTGWPWQAGAQAPHHWLRNALQATPINTGAWSLFTVLVGASIAFVLWWFRDTNQLWQIENQRKDINLKDFQKLSEWASGLHLVEAQSTETKEWSEGSQGGTLKRVQSTVMPAPQQASASTAHAHSRAEGAASLQITAVYQLQAFLKGEYGSQFQRPAFALLLSLWSAIVQKSVAEWKDEYAQALGKHGWASDEPEVQAFKNWQSHVRSAAATPLAQAITQVLAADHGLALIKFVDALPGAQLAGQNSLWSGIEVPLELAHQNLSGIRAQAVHWGGVCLEGANLWKARLQGADLNGAHLEGADLTSAYLQGVNLQEAHLEGAYLNWAHLEGASLSQAHLSDACLLQAYLECADLRAANLEDADLRSANLDDADFYRANLKGAILREAHMKGADFSSANLEGAALTASHMESVNLGGSRIKGADFRWANLEGARWVNTHASNQTQCQDARTDIHTQVQIQGQNAYQFGAIHPLATHAQRLWLLGTCRLQLVDAAYTEYEEHWQLATHEQKVRAEAIARDPSLLTPRDFEGLPTPSGV